MRAKRYLAGLFTFGIGCALAAAQTADNGAAAASPAVSPRLPPLPQPPVAYFRELLGLSPAELEKTLAGIVGPIRTNLQAKLQQYAALTADEREARLRATELQWYLVPLMSTAPTNRVAQLAVIPDEYRTLVAERLEQWDKLPSDVQKDFLRIQSVFGSEREDVLRGLSPEQRQKLEQQLATWTSLPPDRRRRAYENFRQFFELSPKEKEKTLGAFSDAERQEMEQTLQAFEKLSPAQRLTCIRSFQKFTEITPAERAQFLKNAELWKKMSPDDRQTWRMLVTRLPPLPPGFGQPPFPPKQKSGPPLPQQTLNLTNATP